MRKPGHADWMAQSDETRSIGRRYRRQDEIGTPLCVTVDFLTVGEDGQPGDDAAQSANAIARRRCASQSRVSSKRCVSVCLESEIMAADFYCDEVLSGRTPVEVVHETPNTLAFRHTRPHYAAVHVVVIPKRHIASLVDFEPCDAAIVAEVLEVVRLIARRIAAEHGGAHIVTNVGRYQESKHLHIHIGAG